MTTITPEYLERARKNCIADLRRIRMTADDLVTALDKDGWNAADILPRMADDLEEIQIVAQEVVNRLKWVSLKDAVWHNFPEEKPTAPGLYLIRFGRATLTAKYDGGQGHFIGMPENVPSFTWTAVPVFLRHVLGQEE